MNILGKLTQWYFTKKAIPYWCVLVLDCIIVLCSAHLACYIEYGGMIIMNRFWHITRGMLLEMPLFILSFHLFHTYHGIIRFSSYVDLYRIAKATLLGALLGYLFGRFLISSYSPIFAFNLPAISIPDLKSSFVLFFVSTFIIWMTRLAVKASFESISTDNAVPVAIYGTHAGGIALANSIRSVKDKEYIIQAFITDKKERDGILLLGKKVFYNEAGIASKLKNLGVKTLLVSPLKTVDFRNNQEMVDEITNEDIRIMMMPTAEEWDGKSDLSLNQLHEVEIEDLLPRDEIKVDMDAIGAMLKGERILITGAAGSIGSEMAREVAPYKPAEMILIDQAETPMHDVRLWCNKLREENQELRDMQIETIVGSITNKEFMEEIFKEHRPDYVFHAAAYKHVPMMEDNPAMAVQNNIYGTRVIADLAVKYGTKKFVMISTDKAVNPTNVMGCSKRICEIYCQSLDRKLRTESQENGNEKERTQFITTRFGNVLGSNGSVIPLFREQIKKGGPLTVTHKDIIRYFMLIPEACKLVLEGGTMGNGGEIFVFDMGKPVKIVDLAKRMISLSGAKNIEIKFTGLRDGEKLFEEVLNDAEGTMPTVHPKIKVAKVREYDYDTACHNEERLLETSYSFDDMAIVKVMKEIVPEYKSKVSKYEVLDK